MGNILILLTVVSWAFYSVYGKRLLKKYSANTLIKYTTLSGTVFLIPFFLPDLMQIQHFSVSWITWLNLIYLGGLASAYGYIAWYRALTRLPAVTVGSYLNFRPLLTGIMAAIILTEKISIFVVLGGLLIIAGTYLTSK